MNYVVTAHGADAVSHALVGHFISPDELDLIVSKGSRLVIYTVAQDGLQPFKEVPLYGRIATMQFWRPSGQTQDMLFISTESNKFCILGWDGSEIVTKANGDLSDRIGRPADSGPIAIIEPRCRLIGLHLYDGLFKVIQASPNGSLDGEAFNIRLEELKVIDVKFLHNYQKPTLALLYQDNKEARHLKTYEVLFKEKNFGDGPWSQTNVEAGASMLISVPLGQGVLVLGEHTITYHSGPEFKSIPINFACFKAVGQLDANGSRWLLGDHLGFLYVLVLASNGGSVTGMTLEKLGQTSQASTLSYLDNGVVYVGSAFGDSQLVRLLTEPEDGCFVKEMERYSNLGPIVDFVVVDLERQGQGQVVTCSGAYKDGSLRIVRNGIGINDQASLALQGIKGLWALRSGGAHATHMVLSFISETRVLAMLDDELSEVELPGFDADAATVFCTNFGDAHVLQATAAALRLVDVAGFGLLQEWRPPAGHAISMACVDEQYVLLATTGKQLHLLALRDGQLAEQASTTMAQDVACVALWSQFAAHESQMEDAGTPPLSLAAVGLWTDLSVRLLLTPTLAELSVEPLGVDVIPRSLLFATFEAKDYLLCALGDGRLMSFSVASAAEGGGGQPALGERKVVSLGTQPVSLTRFWSKGTPHVFACSDRPAVVHSANQKLLYSNVNVKEVTHMAPFHSEAFPECLAIASEDGLVIGTIDDIQKLHIRTVPQPVGAASPPHPGRACASAASPQLGGLPWPQALAMGRPRPHPQILTPRRGGSVPPFWPPGAARRAAAPPRARRGGARLRAAHRAREHQRRRRGRRARSCAPARRPDLRAVRLLRAAAAGVGARRPRARLRERAGRLRLRRGGHRLRTAGRARAHLGPAAHLLGARAHARAQARAAHPGRGVRARGLQRQAARRR